MSAEPDARAVMRAIATHLGVDIGVLVGGKEDRVQRHVGARWMTMIILRMRYGLSYRHIGRVMGRKESTVWNTLTRLRRHDRVWQAAGGLELAMQLGRPTCRAIDVDAALRRAREDARL